MIDSRSLKTQKYGASKGFQKVLSFPKYIPIYFGKTISVIEMNITQIGSNLFRAWIIDGGIDKNFVKIEIKAQNVSYFSGIINIFGVKN